MSEETYKDFWPTTPLHDTTVNLKTYTGTPLKVLGVMYITVCYGQLTIAGDRWYRGKSHGSKLARKHHTELHSIHKVNSDHVQKVLTQYSEVFKPELGMIKDFKVKNL